MSGLGVCSQIIQDNIYFLANGHFGRYTNVFIKNQSIVYPHYVEGTI